jgi:hypothetical protein
MPEHMLSHKTPRPAQLERTKVPSTTQDANRWVNGEVCHAETNVRLIRQFRVGWILEWRAPAARVTWKIAGRNPSRSASNTVVLTAVSDALTANDRRNLLIA